MGDPIFDGMQEAPAAVPANQLVPPAADWWYWRRRHPRLYIGRSNEDGSQEDWMRLLAEVGPHRLTLAYKQVARNLNPELKVALSRVLEALGAPEADDKPAPLVPSSVLVRRWKDDAWGRVCDLCINPETFLKFRYGTNDPERIKKATALAKEIQSWFPEAKNKLDLATLVVSNPEKVTILIDRRLIPPMPAPPTRRP
jgi:hypothetical protein